MPPGKLSSRGKVNKASKRGRVRKPGTRDAARGSPKGEILIKGAARGRGRSTIGARTSVRELLPDYVKKLGAPAQASDRTTAPADTASDKSMEAAQMSESTVVLESSAPRVERIYNDIWASGPASFAFATHGSLDHDQDTIVIALNILDHIIRPENWNPELSNNKLSAASFFFASRLTGKKATATQIAGSIWIDPVVVAGMAQSEEGPLYNRMLESLTVNAAQVVQGYEILYAQREGLIGLLGEYAAGIDSLPLPAIEKETLKSEAEDGPYTSEVAAIMTKLGYQRGSGLGEEAIAIVKAENLTEAENGICLDSVLEEEMAGEDELDSADLNNDFEDFVADNE